MKVIAKVDLQTNDWKTASVRPDDFPIIPAGTLVEYEGEYHNFYGTWAKIRGATGYAYYVDPKDVKKTEEEKS